MNVNPERIKALIGRLERAYPDARTELHHHNCFELLVATILSAQCTDERVNRVTPELFEKYPSAARMAQASLQDVAEIIRSTGFYKNKAKSLIGCAKVLSDRFRGEVPSTLEDLVSLPGVWRKTANVILGNCFHQPAIVVDTHVRRVARRLGLTDSDDPDRIEAELAGCVPRKRWTAFSHRLLLHGRYVCRAKAPHCSRCPLSDICEAPEKIGDASKKGRSAGRRRYRSV